jgi:hypothetical protein
MHGLEGRTNSVKNQMLESQNTIIQLQSELLKCKNEQLNSLENSVKSSVKSSVGESVKAELEMYSAVLTNNSSESQKIISCETIKKVVQTVVQEEDRSKNLMIFGLPEQENEQLESVVNEVFQEIGEKPRVEACRFGKPKSSNVARPVKVTAACATIINQILAKSRSLRKLEKYKTVFVSPDRSLEQRLTQRQLVTDMKKLNSEHPDKVHFIRDSRIITVDKTKTGVKS